MDAQRTGRLFGWLFIATFVTAIAARLFFVDGLGATWQEMRFIPGAGSETSLKLGGIFEFLLIIANIGTAVVLYPIVKRQSETSRSDTSPRGSWSPPSSWSGSSASSPS